MIGTKCLLEKIDFFQWQLFQDYAIDSSGSLSVKTDASFTVNVDCLLSKQNSLQEIFASITAGSHWTSLTIRNYGLTTNFTTNFDRVMFTYRGFPVSLNELHKVKRFSGADFNCGQSTHE